MNAPDPRAARTRLEQTVERDAARIDRARKERTSVLAEMSYLGALGTVFVLPVVAGAYLGDWLDSHLRGYSVHWTLTLIVVGVFVGAVNVYLMIRKP